MKRFLIFICALSMFSTSNAATLNFRHNDTITKIELDTIKRTSPALATQIDGTVYYANLKPVTERVSNNAYITYGGNIYEIQDNYKYPFSITTIDMPAGTKFEFETCASGKFIVDWGDGEIEQIDRTDDITRGYFSHIYESGGVYKIQFGGRATWYDYYEGDSAIAFYNGKDVAKIDGSLGAIFPTIGDGDLYGTRPYFFETFARHTNLSSLPENLFDGVSRGSFNNTFYNCTGLTSIPANLFADIKDDLYDGYFWATFYGCTGLTGPSAKINGKYLYEIWPDATESQVGKCYRGATGLSDYDNIPDAWK